MKHLFVPGDVVRMTETYKNNSPGEHTEEFGHCLGVVLGKTFKNEEGPELDVRWFPSLMRYGYHPDDLELVVSNRNKH